ncbi:MAG: dTMP kinase [Caldithrix sp.]|nr:dTMP kinase [Caldithrix sp.]
MNKINNKRFISFEGIDYSGKTTQINLLKTYLETRNEKVFILREPGGTVISEQIRMILLDTEHDAMDDYTEILLYSAARSQLVQEKIIPLLQQDYFVIADRYVDSTTAYQGFGRGIDAEIVQQINQVATRGVLPRFTFYMELSPQKAQERRKQAVLAIDRLESAGIEFYERVFNGYRTIAQSSGDRFHILDAEKNIEQIHRKIIQIINQQI